MTEVPKIVYDRLHAGLPKGAHPEADLLTAFAEQSLSATERDAVLEHMARCGDCREIVALALPVITDVATPIAANSTEEVAVSVSPLSAPASRKPTFTWAWPQLRWAALAAGVAVAASVLLLHPGKVNHPNLPSTSQIATAIQPTSVPPTPQPQLASPPAALASAGKSANLTNMDEGSTRQSLAVKSSAGLPVTRQSVTPSAKQHDVAPVPLQASPRIAPPSTATAPTRSSTQPSMAGKVDAGKADNARLNTGSQQMSRQPQAGAAAVPAYQVKSEVLIADNKKDSSDKPDVNLPDAARALDQGASAASGTTEAVAVSGAAVAVQKPSGNILMAQNNAPAIVKAKEPPPGVGGNKNARGEAVAAGGSAGAQGRNVTSLAKSAAPSGSAGALIVTWEITAGVLQRSRDSGQTWQTALRTDHPLLCSASHDTDVWAGGQAGTLFHSTNGGVTWTQVHPSIKDQQLSSDVTHIDLRSSTQLLVSTSNNEVWITLDGGTTWGKK
jgi:Putative zinc-finger